MGAQDGETTRSIAARIPADLAESLAALARSRGVSKSKLIRSAIASFVAAAGGGNVVQGPWQQGGEAPSAPPPEVAAAPLARIRELVEEIQSCDGDPNNLDGLVVLCKAILMEALERMSANHEHLIRWAVEGHGVPPTSIMDPLALMPVVGEVRKLVATIHKVHNDGLWTQAQVVRAMEGYGDVVRQAVLDVARAQLRVRGKKPKPDDLAELILERVADGWRALPAPS